MSSETSPNEGATDGTTTDAGVACVDDNMGRCSELQAEWNKLREEQDKIAKDMSEAVAPTEDQVMRDKEISSRLKAITAEMTQVLERAQEKLPLPEDEEEDEIPERLRTGKHRLERTYESTDSEGPPEDRTESSYPKVYDESSPSRQSESKSTKNTTSSSNRTVTTTLGQKLRSTLRTAQNSLTGNGSSATANLTAAEREKLKAEESRLERELYEIGEKASLDEAGEKRVAEVTARLKEIADLNLDAIPGSGVEDKGQSIPKRNKSMVGNRNKFAAKAKAFVSNVSSPRHRPSGPSKPNSLMNPDPPSADVTDARAPDANDSAASTDATSGVGRGNSPSSAATSRDKDKDAAKKSTIAKRWGTLKKHVTKLSGGAGGSKSNASSPASSSQKTESPSSVKVAAASAASNGNEYTEVRDRLAQRGEKLSGLGKDAAEMREGATDMLAAAKALRKKNEKRNIF